MGWFGFWVYFSLCTVVSDVSLGIPVHLEFSLPLLCAVLAWL